MKIVNFQCSQCGSSDFETEGQDKLRCTYCSSLFGIEKPAKKQNSGVIIQKGAKVTFGKNANVIIKGGLNIEEGAEVEINGNINLIEKSADDEIQSAKNKLKKIQE